MTVERSCPGPFQRLVPKALPMAERSNPASRRLASAFSNNSTTAVLAIGPEADLPNVANEPTAEGD